MKSKIAAGILAAGFAISGLPAIASATPVAPTTLNEDGTVTIQIISTNDAHGRIGEMTVPWAGAIEEARTENEHSLFISAGDNQGASLFASSIANDEPIMDVFNIMELDATAGGNHEFDKGMEDLQRIEDYLGLPQLGANVYDADGNAVMQEYAILETAGLKVGVIGTVPNDLSTLVSESAIAGLTIGDEVEATNRVALEIADEVDIIVASMHMGSPVGEPEGATWDSERAKPGFMQKIDTELTPLVDVVLNAHTHRVYNWEDTVEETGKTRPVVQTGEYMNNIAVIEVTYDPATGEVVDFTSEIRPKSSTPVDELISTYPRVAEVDATVKAAIEEAAVLGEVQVGSITADITREGVSGEDTSYPGESALGNLITDMFLREGEIYGADIAMGNAGGVRADLLYGDDGVVTYSELQAVMPFVNNQFVVDLSGAQVIELINQQFQNDSYNHISFSSNLTYTYNPEAADGDKVVDVFYDGAPIDLDATYGIITYGFLATGTTGFPVFQDAIASQDTGQIDLDMFRDAFEPSIAGEPISPDFARRTAQLNGAPTGAVEPGGTVTFQLGDLDLTSAGTPLAAEITGALVSAQDPMNRVELGNFAATDGAAEISFEVPEVAGGDWLIELTVAEAGTVVRVPLTVDAAGGTTPPTDTTGATETATTTPTGGEDNGSGDDKGSDNGKGDSDDNLAQTGASPFAVVFPALAVVAAGLLLHSMRSARITK
ncbi:MAG: bifunctional metallophosphatase/5'-nucleotidase [Gulosibacter sp.]|uniref:bifunctional metallophosphatase/5'-nucleotidase n=1 Tax=Gulosibacter sp. TaxID=2817531 RepID=UPI003F908D53